MNIFTRTPLFLFFLSSISSYFLLTGCSNFSCSNKECIDKKKNEATEVLDTLKTERNDRLQSMYDKYDREYQEYYQELKSTLYKIPVKNHEDLVRQCDQFQVVCNKLERAAILKYSIQLIGSKIQKIDYQINQLEQNIWKLDKKLEMGEIAPEDQGKINELIASTGILLKQDIDPPKSQDVAKIQQDIFNNLLK